ncbi:type II toxin-antitoxin system VapC family toxin [Haloarcula sediminis]|uniref:type II toxin-antitoxin system VapC family toxin n=1 Tax=Haloarcula sediminis TaxID=3111777 RepID=UPI002D79E934|nr:PIN domain-containing protein [Haloarcula sp. CK38]
MNRPGATPIFVDTGAFYARADEDDKHHQTALQIFDKIRSGDIAYRPIFTSQSVLSELATLTLYKLGHKDAIRALNAIRDSESINVVPVGRATFEAAAEQFADYDDQEISFVDHTTSILADERDIEHVFAFDGDFRTLGFTLVPEDVELQEM